MIELNLNKTQAYIVGNYSAKSNLKFGGIAIFVIFLACIPFAAVAVVKSMSHIEGKKEEKVAATKEEIAAVSRVPNNEAVIEDIIDSVVGFREDALADKNYDNMTKYEQLDYKVKFTALVFEEFVKVLPAELTFNTIRVSDYKTLFAEGTAPDRQSITKLLSRLSTGNWELLPKPNTTISDGGTFYYFKVEARYLPTIDMMIDNPINPKFMPDVARLEGVKKSVVAAARNAGIKTTGLTLINSTNEPDEKRYVYNIKLNGNFVNIIKFLKSLTKMKEPVAVERITMKSQTKTVETNAVIVINLR